MVERPIILFGQPNKAEKTKRGGGAPVFHRPSHQRQAQRLAPKMTALQNAVATIKQSPMGIEAEKTLVFDVIGDAEKFYTAVKRLGSDAEWIFDMPQDFDTSEDFYVMKKEKGTENIVRDTNKSVIGGKIYCVLSNARAMEEILSLWKSYSNDENTCFPKGKTGLRDVFDTLKNMSFWGYKQRIQETGILEKWKEDLQNPSPDPVRCEIEFFYRRDVQKRFNNEQKLRNEITSFGGTVISSSVIPEIAYHSVLVEVPRTVAEKIVNGDKNISIVTTEQIMFFRPVGQAVVISKNNSFDSPEIIPSSDDLIKEPIIAIFDGMPQENHPFLQGRLIVDDPDKYETGYIVKTRNHGTSMASLVALGDLGGGPPSHVATHKIYVRPIMKPIQFGTDYYEQTPEDSLLVDKIHVAVRRLFEDDAGKVAPTVKVINLSIGLYSRQFDRAMSPLARLLDYLSFKYNVLFVVSAGNHSEDIDTGKTFSDFCALSMDERDTIIIKHINRESRNLRLLSPAESLNALTVGTTFDDLKTFSETSLLKVPCSDGMPAPTSAIGKGLNNAVKPDIIYPGGRQCVRSNDKQSTSSTIIEWSNPSDKIGTVAASPRSSGSKVMCSFGTSNSAALISHEASRCYDILLEVFAIAGQRVPDEQIALLLKTMLIHGASWGDSYTEKFAKTLSLVDTKGDISRALYSDNIHRFLGYGKPKIDRVLECAQNRVTLIGYGKLKNGNAFAYDLPLPFDFSATKVLRRMTATLSFFSPIVSSRQKYRKAQVWFDLDERGKTLFSSRVDVSDKAVSRGSVQHEIFENDNTVVWDENDPLQIKVNCRGVADENFTEEIPYALMVSFEIKDAIDIDVYAKVTECIAPKATV